MAGSQDLARLEEASRPTDGTVPSPSSERLGDGLVAMSPASDVA
jgi:hypothetical protein